MSTLVKTPISLLSETLLRHGIHPMYILQQSAIGVNQGEFVYKVTAGDGVSAFGRGRSKKEARQDAAKNALEVIKSGAGGAFDIAPTELLGQMDVISSPYESEVKINHIGKLIDWCHEHNIPLPDFVLVREDGPPHAKLFEITVTVSKMTQSGIGRTKQQARQLAARNMLAEMEGLAVVDIAPAQEFNNYHTDLPNLETIFSQYKEVKNDKRLGTKIGQELLHPWSPEEVSFIQGFEPQPQWLQTEEPDAGALLNINMLEEICQELNLSTEVFFIPCEPSELAMELICMTVSTKPEICFMAEGKNENIAKHNAACSAIEHLKIMTS